MPYVLKQLHNITERVLAAMPGWMFLISGLTLLGLALVMPEWQRVEDLRWKRDLMRQQVARLEAQQQRYELFHQALKADDPIVLERLAFTQLRMKPVGKQPLVKAAPDPVAQDPELLLTNALQREAQPQQASDAPQQDPTLAAVDAWLAEPLPTVGVDIAPPKQVDSRLMRLTTGERRFVLMIAALACLAGGIWSRGQRGDASPTTPNAA